MNVMFINRHPLIDNNKKDNQIVSTNNHQRLTINGKIIREDKKVIKGKRKIKKYNIN